MKTTGVVRRLDELGRVTLPIELRRSFQLEERDAVEIYVEGDSIILKKYISSDIFTGSKENLVEYKGKLVSKETIKELAALAGLKVTE
ncbi:MAG: AbrB/MazE/SpoVT family DNA-binding domain-containing protein [Lachnospiraceae bacterium]|nr:AbrB/MazE/SpoVT family DNA-binding domain-containing protein [Lachnospiraceae bacterium]